MEQTDIEVKLTEREKECAFIGAGFILRELVNLGANDKIAGPTLYLAGMAFYNTSSTELLYTEHGEALLDDLLELKATQYKGEPLTENEVCCIHAAISVVTLCLLTAAHADPLYTEAMLKLSRQCLPMLRELEHPPEILTLYVNTLAKKMSAEIKKIPSVPQTAATEKKNADARLH